MEQGDEIVKNLEISPLMEKFDPNEKPLKMPSSWKKFGQYRSSALKKVPENLFDEDCHLYKEIVAKDCSNTLFNLDEESREKLM